jgi:hypothetical protein
MFQLIVLNFCTEDPRLIHMHICLTEEVTKYRLKLLAKRLCLGL